MQPLDDVATLAHRPQRGLGVIGDHPLARADLFREAEGFQLAQAAHLLGVERVRLGRRVRRHVDDAHVAPVAHELPVELGPAFRLDLPVDIATDVEVCARPEVLRNEIGRTSAHAFLDVVAGDDQILAVIGAAAQDDMDMGIVGVPVIDPDPVEFGAEVFLHLAHQLAGEFAEICHLHRVLGRDDETEVVAILPAALGESLAVHIAFPRTEQPGLLPVTGDAVATQIVEMRLERRRTHLVTHHPCLDDYDARAASKEPVGTDACRAAAAEGRAVSGGDAPRA